MLHAAFESSQNFDDVFLIFNNSSDCTHISATISAILRRNELKCAQFVHSVVLLKNTDHFADNCTKENFTADHIQLLGERASINFKTSQKTHQP